MSWQTGVMKAAAGGDAKARQALLRLLAGSSVEDIKKSIKKAIDESKDDDERATLRKMLDAADGDDAEDESKKTKKAEDDSKKSKADDEADDDAEDIGALISRRMGGGEFASGGIKRRGSTLELGFVSPADAKARLAQLEKAGR